MSGRLEQLARQIRRLRSTPADPGRTLQRALHLASDIAAEDDDADFAGLVEKGILERGAADRLAALAAKERVADEDVNEAAVVDLDVFLRSVEIGAPALPLPIVPLGESPKLPPGTKKASANVSGRVVTLVGQGGRGFVLVDDKPIGQPFDLAVVPMDAPDVSRAHDGSVTLAWEGAISLVIAPDYRSVTVLGD